MNESAGTHRTRLDRRIQGGAREPVVPDDSRGFSQSNDFRVCSRIVRSDHRISAARYYAAAEKHYRPYRDFTVSPGSFGLSERLAHKFFVGWFHVAYSAFETNAYVTDPRLVVSRIWIGDVC
jgi:hypothetical protein